MQKKTSAAFTLIELILVVVISLILAAIAIPNYIQSTERARGREAQSILNAIIAGEDMYSSERGALLSLTTANNNAWLAIGLENPNNNLASSFAYTFDSGTRVATARRTQGNWVNRTITLDWNRNTGGDWPF